MVSLGNKPAIKPIEGSTKRFKTLVFSIALVAGLGSFGVAYAYTARQRGDNASNASALPNCSGNCVYLKETAAGADVMSVTAGSFVEFTSADGERHNLSLVQSDHGASASASGGSSHGTSDAGADTDHDAATYTSGDFAADEAWRVQFKKDGAFTFEDKYNPKIRVNVVVYTPGKEYKIE